MRSKFILYREHVSKAEYEYRFMRFYETISEVVPDSISCMELLLIIASNEQSVIDDFIKTRARLFSHTRIIWVAQQKMQALLPGVVSENDRILPWNTVYSPDILTLIKETVSKIDAFLFFELQCPDTRNENLYQVGAMLQKEGVRIYGIDRDGAWYEYSSCETILETIYWYKSESEALTV